MLVNAHSEASFFRQSKLDLVIHLMRPKRISSLNERFAVFLDILHSSLASRQLKGM